MKIAFLGRKTQNTNLQSLEEFLASLENIVSYRFHKDYADEIKELVPKWDTLVKPYIMDNLDELESCDFAYSFGGDGTFLASAIQVGAFETPLLGINFGRLGFLTAVKMENLIDVTRELVQGRFNTETRTVMQVESEPEGLFGSRNFGLNDLTIHKSKSNEMITVHVYLNGEFLNSYWGDGLIISTATGSTAYSLSCGGPIIHPSASAFVITPVAPHSLTVRPIVIPDDFIVSLDIESRSGEAMISLDTQTKVVSKKVQIAIKKADFGVKLVRKSTGNYFHNLRDRLMWGRDSRN